MTGIPFDAEGRRIYKPDGATLRDYIAARNFVDIIRGPIGSGTSTASCMRIYSTAMQQRKSSMDGVRRSRWCVVRNTYPELETSTLKTWLFWFPENQYGTLKRSRPMAQTIKVGDVELEVWFLALDNEDDIKKMRSTEWTGFWFNELEWTMYEIFSEAVTRVGRYPSVAEGGSEWYGVIGDMNAPNELHWLPRMTGEADYPDEVPDTKRVYWPKNEDGSSKWGYFIQPPAVIETVGPGGKGTGKFLPNPRAENLRWLDPSYYIKQMDGLTPEKIRNRLCNKISFVIDGDPVWTNVDADLHFSPVALPYTPGREVVVALDFGRTRPAALIAQEIGSKIQVQREFRLYNAGAEIFAPALKRFLEQHYRGARIRFVGDPKGRDKGAATERSAYDIFRGFGMIVEPAKVKNNDLAIRLGAVSYALQTNRILVAPECSTLRPALAGKYHFKRTDLGEPEPVKDKYSDIADCLQYLCVFLGEGRQMMGLEAVETGRAVRASAMGRLDLRRVR